MIFRVVISGWLCFNHYYVKACQASLSIWFIKKYKKTQIYTKETTDVIHCKSCIYSCRCSKLTIVISLLWKPQVRKTAVMQLTTKTTMHNKPFHKPKPKTNDHNRKNCRKYANIMSQATNKPKFTTVNQFYKMVHLGWTDFPTNVLQPSVNLDKTGRLKWELTLRNWLRAKAKDKPSATTWYRFTLTIDSVLQVQAVHSKSWSAQCQI